MNELKKEKRFEDVRGEITLGRCAYHYTFTNFDLRFTIFLNSKILIINILGFLFVNRINRKS